MLKRLRVQSWAEFSRAVKTGATAGKVAATVVSRMERRTKTGNKMGIMGLSDPTGHFEAVLFSEGLAQYRDVLEPGAAVLLQLGAELQGEDVRARVLHAEPLDAAAAKTQKGLRIFVRDTKPLDSIAKRLNMPEAAAPAGSPRGPQAKPAPCAVGRRRWRRVAGHHARSRDRGGNEAARPLQGLAADRRRDQGGGRRGGRADAVAKQKSFPRSLPMCETCLRSQSQRLEYSRRSLLFGAASATGLLLAGACACQGSKTAAEAAERACRRRLRSNG